METIIYNNKYRSVRQYREIIFFQRRGIDSIAFILYDKNREKPYGLIRERKPVLDYRYHTENCLKENDYVFATEHGVFLQTAFGGSNDTITEEEYKKFSELERIEHFKELVKKEALEEAGYSVEYDKIHYTGKDFVSTQMNQFCYLFYVDVTGLEKGEPTTTSEIEKLATVEWLSAKEISAEHDWKAKSILFNMFIE